MRVIAELYSVLDAEAASVALVEDESDEIILNAAGPVAERVSGMRLPLGHGILGWVIANRQPVIVNDVATDARFWSDVDGYSGFKTRSILCVPLFAGQEVIGAIEVLNKRRNGFDTEDLHFLEAFSVVAASAIENARRFRQEQRRRREADALRRVWEALTTPRELDDLLDVILDQLAQLIEYRSATILFVTEEGGLELGAWRGEKDRGAAVQVAERLGLDAKVHTMLETRQPLLIPDTRADPRWQHFPGFSYIRSWIGAPLLIKGHLIGTLNIDHDQVGFYHQDHARLLTGFAHQAAVAIENSRLYAATREASIQLAKQARRMVTLYETSRSLLSGLELDRGALHQLVNRIVDLVGARYGILDILAENGHPSLFLTAGLPEIEARGLDLIKDSLLAALNSEREIIKSDTLAGLVGAQTALPFGLVENFMGVAIHARGQLLGRLMLVGKPNGEPFDQDDEALALALATNLAGAIENASLYAKTQQRLRELVALYEISRTVTGMKHPGDVYTHLTRQVASLLDAQRCAFFIFRDGFLECQAPAFGLTPEIMPRLRFHLHEGDALYNIVQTPDPLMSNAVMEDPDLRAVRPLMDELGIHHLLSCRIPIDERQVGLLVVADRQGGEPFSDQDRHLISIMAHQVSSVLQRTLFQSRQQEHAQIQAALLEVSQAISSLTNLDVLLQTIARITHQLVESDHCFIASWEERLAAFVPRAQSGLGDDWDQMVSQAQLKPGALTFIDTVTETRQAVVLTSDDIRTTLPVWTHALLGTESSLIVPLVIQERVVGLIVVGYLDKTSLPGEREIALVTGIARQAAIAVENAHLYQDLQAHAARLEGAYRELKDLDASKTQFIQNVSHELRTPFTLIKGYLELLLEEEMGSLNQRQKEGLIIVAERTSELGQLIDDIVTIQSIDAASLDPHTFDLGLLIQATLETFQAHARQLRFQSEVLSDLPAIQADAGMIERALKHLLDNAVKFSPDGGKITVCVWYADEAFHVKVEDQGIGIPAESLPYIFDRFYQVDGSTTRRFGGTGLGLSIVKQIIEAHGGRIDAQSVEGQGSAFYFVLPMRPPSRDIL